MAKNDLQLVSANIEIPQSKSSNSINNTNNVIRVPSTLVIDKLPYETQLATYLRVLESDTVTDLDKAKELLQDKMVLKREVGRLFPAHNLSSWQLGYIKDVNTFISNTTGNKNYMRKIVGAYGVTNQHQSAGMQAHNEHIKSIVNDYRFNISARQMFEMYFDYYAKEGKNTAFVSEFKRVKEKLSHYDNTVRNRAYAGSFLAFLRQLDNLSPAILKLYNTCENNIKKHIDSGVLDLNRDYFVYNHNSFFKNVTLGSNNEKPLLMIVRTPMLIDDLDTTPSGFVYTTDIRAFDGNYDNATVAFLSNQRQLANQPVVLENIQTQQLMQNTGAQKSIADLYAQDLISVDANTLEPVGQNTLHLDYLVRPVQQSTPTRQQATQPKVQTPKPVRFDNFEFAANAEDFDSRYGQYLTITDKNPLATYANDGSLVVSGERFKDLLEPYMSRNDRKILNSLVDSNKSYQTEAVELSLAVVSHLRSLGLQFKLDNVRSQSDALSLLFNGPNGSKTSLRLYDAMPQYIGSVFSGGLRYHIKSDSNIVGINEVNAMIDYALGRKRLPVDSHKYSASTVNREYDNGTKNAAIFKNTTVDLGNNVKMMIEESFSLGRKFYTSFGGDKNFADDFMRSYLKLGTLAYAQLITGNSLELVDANLAQRQIDFMENLNKFAEDNFDDENRPTQEELKEIVNSLNSKLSSLYHNVYNDFNTKAETSDQVDIILNRQAVYDFNANMLNQSEIYGIEFSEIETLLLNNLVSDGLKYQSYRDYEDGELLTLDTLDNSKDLSELKVDLDHLITGTYGRLSSSNSLSNDILNTVRHSSISTDNLVGSDYTVKRYRDLLVDFDPTTARNVANAKSESEAKVLEFVQNELNSMSIKGDENGNGVAQVLIDDNGIISYKGYRPIGGLRAKSKVRYNEISGKIGQIFLPDDKGMIKTNFNSGENFAIVPSYRGYFQFEGIEDGEDRMSRFRVEGFDQALYSQLSVALHQQLESVSFSDTQTPESTTMLNKLYTRDLLKMKFDYDWYENHDLDTEVKDRIIKTLSRKVRLDNELGESAGSFAELEQMLAEQNGNENYTPDVLYRSVDNRNIRVLDADYKGYFDPVMTGTNRNQGLVLYIGDGVEISDDGTLTPVTDKAGQVVEVTAPIRELDSFKYQPFNAWDRNQMASNQILTASTVSKNTNVLMDAFGGWTHEDSAVVSKAFAEKNMVVGEDGNLRPLRIGDKISDFGGNKATISLVVDPDMELEDARRNGLEMPVEIFAQNPDLDVVMSPYSVISRCNAGVVHELINSDEKHEINYYNQNTGEVTKIGVTGQLNIIVTDMLVDKKSHIYTEEDKLEGKGRKASGQLGWAALENNLKDSIDIFWGQNDSAIANLREYMLITGLDVAADGTLQVGYHAHETEHRPVINIRDLYQRNMENGVYSFDANSAIATIGSNAGVLELPFEIELVAKDKNGKNIRTNQLPIMSAAVRTNRVNIDDNLEINNYTKNYAEIMDLAYSYVRDIEAKLKPAQLELEKYQNRQLTDDEQIEYDKLKTRIDKYYASAESRITKAQQKYKVFANDVIYGKLGGLTGEADKRSYIRTDVMGKRMSRSATLVITADPRLRLDGVAVSPELDEMLNPNPDSKFKLKRVAIHRDPCLRGAAITGVQIQRIDPNVTGLAINPLAASKFNGDFDGDSAGLWGSKDKRFQKEVRENLSLANNFIDKTDGVSPVIDISMGYVSAAVATGAVSLPTKEDDPSPATQLKDKVLSLYHSAETPQLGLQAVDEYLHGIINSKKAFGCSAIDVTSNESALKSLGDIVTSGAKGSPKALAEFKQYFDGKMGEKEAREIQRASGIKSDLTGLAGSYSQKLTKLLRDVNPALGLEITFPATQATLQIKHNASLAVSVSVALSVNLRSYLNGYLPNDKDRKPINRQQFVEGMTQTFEDIGLPISPVARQRFEDLADILEDKTTGEIRSIDDLVYGKLDEKVKASTLDLIAYGGGFTMMNTLAHDGRSLAEGENTKRFLPKAMVLRYEGHTVDENGKPLKDVVLKQDVRLDEEANLDFDELELDSDELTYNDLVADSLSKSSADDELYNAISNITQQQYAKKRQADVIGSSLPKTATTSQANNQTANQGARFNPLQAPTLSQATGGQVAQTQTMPHAPQSTQPKSAEKITQETNQLLQIIENPQLAKLKINGTVVSLEDAVQNCKLYRGANGEAIHLSANDAKGLEPIGIELNGVALSTDYISQYRDRLWYAYLKKSPELQDVLEKTQQFGNSENWQSVKAFMCDANGNICNKELRGEVLRNNFAGLEAALYNGSKQHAKTSYQPNSQQNPFVNSVNAAINNQTYQTHVAIEQTASSTTVRQAQGQQLFNALSKENIPTVTSAVSATSSQATHTQAYEPPVVESDDGLSL